MRNSLMALAIAFVACGFAAALADNKAPSNSTADKKDGATDIQCCPMDPKASAALERVKKLAGTWVMQQEAGKPEMKIEYRPTANGTAVIETMFPGHPHEMVNLYTADGDSILLTHYCAQGVQPRMRLSSGDAKAMKFEFVDGGNIKSRNDAHMDSVTLTIDGDTLKQDWAYYADGKIASNMVFELKRAK